MQCTTGLPHPCRQCLSCQINARRIWVGRLMLEAQCHEHSFFSTFTYEREPSDASVHKRHISRTMHRLREAARVRGSQLRFFAVGEYGEQGHRPHYHAAVFGLPEDHRELITACWHRLRDPVFGAKPGFCHHGDLSPDSASYLSGYITKKLGKAALPAGLAPEFAVMSRRPGIGMLYLEALIEGLNTNAGALYMARNGDVPVAVSVEGKTLPIGRSLRDHLRTYFFGEPGQPKAAKLIAERQFNATLPVMPLDASPVLRARVLSLFHSEATEAHHKHFETLKQRARQRANKFAIWDSHSRKL